MTLRRKFVTGVMLCAFPCIAANAQSDTVKKRTDALALGVGTGLSYAGPIGLKITGHPVPHLGFFIGVGWWSKDLSLTAGIRVRPLPGSAVSPHIHAMYGRNDANPYRDNHGLSAGIGTDFFNTPGSPLYLTLGADMVLRQHKVYLTGGLNFNLHHEARKNRLKS